MPGPWVVRKHLARLTGKTFHARRTAGAWSYKVLAVFWPLIVGFIIFVLLAVLLGWILDPTRRENGH